MILAHWLPPTIIRPNHAPTVQLVCARMLIHQLAGEMTGQFPPPASSQSFRSAASTPAASKFPSHFLFTDRTSLPIIISPFPLLLLLLLLLRPRHVVFFAFLLSLHVLYRTTSKVPVRELQKVVHSLKVKEKKRKRKKVFHLLF